jgi:hypothetical protein
MELKSESKLKGYLIIIPYLIVSIGTTLFIGTNWIISSILPQKERPTPYFKTRSIICKEYKIG